MRAAGCSVRRVTGAQRHLFTRSPTTACFLILRVSLLLKLVQVRECQFKHPRDSDMALCHFPMYIHN